MPRSVNTARPLSWIGLIAAELSGKVLRALACQLYSFTFKPKKNKGSEQKKDASLAKSGPDCKNITLERLGRMKYLQLCEFRQI